MSTRSLASTATSQAEAVPESAPSVTRTRPALWLVRHGESTWNTAGLAQGHNDEAELTERGLRQAAEAAGQFHGRAVCAIYASDLRRAGQTAAAFGAVLDLPVHTDARLRERSLGVLEGSLSITIDESVTGLAGGLVIDPDTRPPAGESVRDLYLRAAEFCDDLAARLRDARDRRAASPGPADPGPADSEGDVLVIAHGGTVRVLDAYLHGVPVDEMTWRPVGNLAIVRIPEFGSQPRGGNR
jgi:2,3-bisphosphoglycerate-dependent phosphoglycerate mutase